MGCNEDEYIKELQEEKTKLLQEIRTLTNERVEFREEIKELKKQVNLKVGTNDRDIYWKNFYKMAIQERQIIKQAAEIKRKGNAILKLENGINVGYETKISQMEETILGLTENKEGE